MLRRSLALIAALGLAPALASAQQRPGWALDRYDTPFGGDLTLVADTPWYSGGAGFLIRAAITGDYAYRPLVLRAASNDTVVVEHMLVGHAQVAAAFADRVGVSLSLPVSLLQSGGSVAGAVPQAADGVAASDLRLGLRARLLGHADLDAFSLHVGALAYIPGLSQRADNTSDESFRLRAGVTAAGKAGAARWSVSLGAHLRFADLVVAASSSSPGVSVAHELFATASLHLVGAAGRFMIGPEFSMQTPFAQAFQNENAHAEVVLSTRVFFTPEWSLGAALGPGLTQGAGTPALRALLQVGYTPPERRAAAAVAPRDRDQDGVLDPDDLCPDEPQGPTPDPERRGCPQRDRDRDGVADARDLCIDVPQGPNPDPARAGCPLPDSDGDGVFDDVDRCVNTPQGEHPDPNRRGCPAGDRDNDHVLDPSDLCPDEPDGIHPDPDRLGCPAPDRDGDNVIDASDACPDQPGAPSPNPRRNGCPGLVRIVDGRISILRPVFFATNRDVILARSFPVLNAVRDALLATPEIRHISIEGHTDDVGREEANLDLSQRRAESVRRWLTQHQIDPNRLEARGFGESRPLVPNNSNAARAQNRRVEFRIVEQ